MIRYSLQCDADHEFVSWFADSDAFDEQARRGLVACPNCQSTQVRKSIMAPRVAGPKSAEPAPAGAQAPDPGADLALAVDSGRDIRAMLKSLRDHLKANADDVGEQFPTLARKMHYGEAEHRSIYGQSTLDEARKLHEEGIQVLPLPSFPDDRN